MSIVSLTAKPITVGWGKKETQFHGSVGKPTAANMREIVSTAVVHNVFTCIQVALPPPDILLNLQAVVRNWI